MDDRELAALLAAGEQRGLDELLLRYGPMLSYIVGGILREAEEREECLSELTMLVWEKIGSFDPQRGSLSSWLAAMARNRARNRLRDGARRPETGELDPGLADPAPGPEELLLRQERAQALRQAVDRLGSMERALFYRKYYYLQSTVQMAAELGLTERGVEGRLRRLRIRLRRELGGEWND